MGNGPAGPFGAPPQQSPRIDLPLAEYFNLAPNRTVAINNRNSVKGFAASALAVPANTVGTLFADLPLIPQWGPSQGIYIVRMFTGFVPSDSSGELQIVGARIGLGSGTGNIFIDLGIPLLSFLAPNVSQQMMLEQQSLYTFRDMQLVGFPPGPLILTTVTTVKNIDATNPHSFNVQVQAIFHQLIGIVE